MNIEQLNVKERVAIYSILERNGRWRYRQGRKGIRTGAAKMEMKSPRDKVAMRRGPREREEREGQAWSLK